MERAALSIQELRVVFRTPQGPIKVLDHITLKLDCGCHTALLGESGCGKSVLAAAVLGLLPPEAQVSGTIRGLGHANLLELSPKALNSLRGRRIILIPQNPSESLNALLSVETHLWESLRRTMRAREGRMPSLTAAGLLAVAGVPEPNTVARMYPHQLSGGMAQKVVIALGLVETPEVVLADEPTKGLDFRAAQNCLKLLRRHFASSSMLLITHDLRIAASLPRIAVMYAGEIVELMPGHELFLNALHPYTQSLVRAHPVWGLQPIPGSAPGPNAYPSGCRFWPRCFRADDRCRIEHPELFPRDANRWVRCFHVMP